MKDYSFTGFEINSTVFKIVYDKEKGWYIEDGIIIDEIVLSKAGGIYYNTSSGIGHPESLFETKEAALLECAVRSDIH